MQISLSCEDAQTMTYLYQNQQGNVIKITSLPVEASMSRNISTSPRTNFAAFALLTKTRNGRVNLINPASSDKNIGNDLMNNNACYSETTLNKLILLKVTNFSKPCHFYLQLDQLLPIALQDQGWPVL